MKVRIYDRLIIAIFIFSIYIADIQAQVFNPIKNCFVDASGECIPTPIITGVPYLRMNIDAALSGLGGSSVINRPNANSLYSNASLMPFANRSSNFALNTVGLKNAEGVLLGISGFQKLTKSSALGIGIRFLDLKDKEILDVRGQILGISKPKDVDVTLSFATKLNRKLSASLSSRFITSNMATGFLFNGIEIKTASTLAMDLGLSYMTETKIAGYSGKIVYGLAISNVGKGISYFDHDDVLKPLPANLNLGSTLELDLGDDNMLTIALSVDKLLVPSPTFNDFDNNNILDHLDKSYFEGLFGSFSDAVGGLDEELLEISGGLGVEFWYGERVAFRTGYHYEHYLKGNNKFYSTGLGLKYKNATLNLAHTFPTLYNYAFYRSQLFMTMLYDFGE